MLGMSSAALGFVVFCDLEVSFRLVPVLDLDLVFGFGFVFWYWFWLPDVFVVLYIYSVFVVS
jgi:hypothetical protein